MRRPLALAVAVLALTGVLTACAPAAEPEADPTPRASVAPTPQPTPTAEARVVAPGEKPPAVFDGDCNRALAPADLQSVVGASLPLATSASDGDVGNIGGLACSWEAGGAAVRVEILPRPGLGDTQFPQDQAQYYFQDCDAQWVCSGEAEDADLWIGASFQSFAEADRDQIDDWTAAIAALIVRNFAGDADPWVRDRTGWWDELDCAAVAGALSRELNTEFSGERGGFIDPPLPGIVLATAASNWSNCYLYDGAHTFEVYSSAGAAWTLPDDGDQPVETGVQGISAWLSSSYQSTTSAGYTMTDGINSLTAYVATDASWTAEEAVGALARAASSDWK
ncbi:hypothetical protein JNB62_16950 [Microbacterium jejuense]|uniref:DUF3558 domain-containing protein n=1 Tax=Microbacterium jejuense TaxID=1263637 RepID=A0ABS7HR76_9MICO|nr:hypothetical protein [Microbacterium jejuense]MBW9095373.1 hypothetical protein [Microbacterium jejuense]